MGQMATHHYRLLQLVVAARQLGLLGRVFVDTVQVVEDSPLLELEVHHSQPAAGSQQVEEPQRRGVENRVNY